MMSVIIVVWKGSWWY